MVTGAEHQKTGENVQSRFRNIAKPALLLLAGVTLAASVHFANPTPVSAYQGEIPRNPIIVENTGVDSDKFLDLQGARTLEEFIRIQEAKDLLQEKYGVYALDSRSDPRDPSTVWVDTTNNQRLIYSSDYLSASWSLGELEGLIELYDQPKLMPRVDGPLWLIRMYTSTDIIGQFVPNGFNPNTILYLVPDANSSVQQTGVYNLPISNMDAVLFHEVIHLLAENNPNSAENKEYYEGLLEKLGISWMSYKDFVGLSAEERSLLYLKKMEGIYTSEEVNEFRKKDRAFWETLRQLRLSYWTGGVVDTSKIYPTTDGDLVYLLAVNQTAFLYGERPYSYINSAELEADMGVRMIIALFQAQGIPSECVEMSEDEVMAIRCDVVRFYVDLLSNP